LSERLPVTADRPHPRPPLRILEDGWRRVVGAPAVWIGAWLLIAAVTLPAALAVGHLVAGDLGSSFSAEAMVRGVDWAWWQEFLTRHPGLSGVFRPSIIGFAPVVRNASDFMDATAPSAWVTLLAVVFGALWLFLLGGILDRYARQRRLGSYGFFGACGTFFWRFLRLAVIVGLFYGLLFGLLHPWLFDTVYPWLTREIPVERTAFLIRLLLYLPFLALVTATMLLVDIAKARAVVEDRRSMLGALVAAARFVRRHPGSAAAVFGANVAIFGLVALCYAILVPGASYGSTASIVYAALIGQLYIAARLGVKLAFMASAVALVQDRLAHAGYTAAPTPVWPDSPAAESIRNG
jgi:hypothetical protein